MHNMCQMMSTWVKWSINCFNWYSCYSCQKGVKDYIMYTIARNNVTLVWVIRLYYRGNKADIHISWHINSIDKFNPVFIVKNGLEIWALRRFQPYHPMLCMLKHVWSGFHVKINFWSSRHTAINHHWLSFRHEWQLQLIKATFDHFNISFTHATIWFTM